MFDGTMVGNLVRGFDLLQQEKLGNYVYALKDPRDGKVFYVGQGTRNRLFDHFKDAEMILATSAGASSKEIRILDIWKNDEDVDWVIIAYALEKDTLDYVESAVMDALMVSQNGQCLNEIRGRKSSMLSAGEVVTLGATRVNPSEPISRVFVFPIHNAVENSKDNVYEATRASWKVTQPNREKESFAVGVKNGISIGSYKINDWEPIEHKHAFTGSESESLLNYNWKHVISQAMGYWQRGNYIIVEFDGQGQFKVIRGSGANCPWVKCDS